MKLSKIIFPGILIFIVLFYASAGYADMVFENGIILEKIVCLNNPEESYALYLPSNYSENKKWPVLIIFDPAARALLPLKLFKNAAEQYGYILVCSNNSRNGPWKHVIDSMLAVWRDLSSRFFIDKKRVYASGFSGGSRAASLFSKITGVEPAGIIACGAGLQEKLTPDKIKNSFYYGIVGIEDFNYKEFKRLEPKLKNAGVNHCIVYIEGDHKWPPEEVLERAIEWMELDAIKRKVKTRNKGLVNRIFENNMDYLSGMLNSDKFYFGILYYENVIKYFSGLSDLKIQVEKVKVLKERSDFVSFQKDEIKRDRSENDMLMNFKRIFFRIEKSDMRRIGKVSLFNELRLPYLKNKAENKKNRFSRAWARRLLYELSVKGQKFSTKYFKEKDYKKAVLFQEIGVESDSSNPWALYNLAALYNITGEKKKAVRSLRKIIELKADYSGYLEKDRNFENLRTDKNFIKVLNEMKELNGNS